MNVTATCTGPYRVCTTDPVTVARVGSDVPVPGVAGDVPGSVEPAVEGAGVGVAGVTGSDPATTAGPPDVADPSPARPGTPPYRASAAAPSASTLPA